MMIGGIKVNKFLLRHESNSGRSHDWEVIFTWESKDGPPKSLKKESRFGNNRRNDAERNWGLPE